MSRPTRALRTLIALGIATSLFGCSSISTLHGTNNATGHQENRYSWLVGCWQTDDGVEETWVQSRQGDQLFGYSVMSVDNKRVFFEQLRLDTQGEDSVLYAYPKGVGPTAFKGTLIDALSVEYTNPSNDYPQRIRYALKGSILHAEISDTSNTKTTAWAYERCR